MIDPKEIPEITQQVFDGIQHDGLIQLFPLQLDCISVSFCFHYIASLIVTKRQTKQRYTVINGLLSPQ